MKKIGRFTIAGLLGKGGMGKVFKVTFPVTG
jgi:serine/threonine-protein kinase